MYYNCFQSIHLSSNEKGCAVMLPAAIDSNNNVNKYFALLPLMEKKAIKVLSVFKNSLGAKCVVLIQSANRRLKTRRFCREALGGFLKDWRT